MTTDNKTLADVQPGGRVRLGDQRSDLVPGIVRCAKCSFQLHRTNLYLQSGAVGAGDSKTEPCPNGCGPLWPVTWETWAREGWAEAERLHLENAALSAQPSPGGQAAHCPVKHCGMTYARVPADGRCHACGATVQPSPGGQQYAWNIAELVRVDLDRQSCPDAYMRIAMESVVKHLAARQPVGEPFGYCADFDPGAHEFSHTFYYLAPGEKVPEGCTPFFAAPPAQAVDLGPGIEAAAKLIQKKADDYAEEFGYDDMGGLSFGRGIHAEVKSDHHFFMLELVDELRALLASQAVGNG
ncbi:hypothetical protein B9Y78_07955 [Stenotrophomonas maltophilia]|uniref:hypothetical protein n=1 Tax=Stenotrophomonas maltophilia TaxID=40324 RepID=UPI000C264945|nr:hypothetical protein [Stenotrophomonas maltophilia]PJL41030.1 hypothetical protein B9Y78_07955 [Stenotrophomonas maltophilia]